MNFLAPALLCDFYKLAHRVMYPEKTEVIYSTWTPRESRIPSIDKVVAFGAQMALQKLVEIFDELFFQVPVQFVCAEYQLFLRQTLGVIDADVSHLRELHKLGHLPICVRALPEGTRVPLRVPMLTIHNTDPRFFWLTNYLETYLSCQMWLPSTAATLAYEYRKLLERYAQLTGVPKEFVQFQGHDFSMRGLSSLESAISSGMGHLLSFVGTDTIPAIQGADYYYDANLDAELVGTSIPATEHSVQCAYGDDLAYFTNIIERVHPAGMVSIVSDGYDFWKVLTETLPALKDKIMARDGKVVIRPDSGDPVKIVCGTMGTWPKGEHRADLSPEAKGAVEVLWDVFGGTVNERGHKVLDPHIGLIYGDAITLDRAREILSTLDAKGFASSNIVFGIGSFTYQYNTRDTFGFAMKSTLAVIDGKEKHIFKDPKTGDGIKKSQKGRVVVQRNYVTQELYSTDGYGLHTVVPSDLLVEIFRDGSFTNRTTFAEIRKRLSSN